MLGGRLMGSSRATAIFLVASVLSGCGANAVIQQYNAEDTQSAADITAGANRVREQCEAEFKSPELDPIRDKVILGIPLNPPVRLLVITDKPTPKEGQALLAWASARERCAGYQRASVANMPLPPSMDGSIKEQVKTGLYHVADQSMRGVNYLTAALYEKRMTYGEFNKQRTDLTTKLMDENSALMATLFQQDRANAMQKAAAAQQQVDAAIDVLQAVASTACAGAKSSTIRALC